MAITGRIDLHMHSTVSDGTDLPSGILRCAKNAGLSLFALTDHDAVSGCEEIRALLSEAEEETPAFLPGVEFSCRDERGKYHILGYGYDTEKPGILEVVDKGHGLRMEKVRARLDFLRERFGFSFSREDLQELLSYANPGKPHIANLMVRYGYAKTKEEGIRDYLNQLRLPGAYVRPEEAIRGILDSGGIPVLAHPSYGSGDQIIVGEEMRERIRYLMDYGLLGLEAYYSGFTPKLQAEILSCAEEYGLYVTAGSDYHGTNKLIAMGENNLACAEEGHPALGRFLERVSELVS